MLPAYLLAIVQTSVGTDTATTSSRNLIIEEQIVTLGSHNANYSEQKIAKQMD